MHGPEQVKRADDVVVLRETAVRLIDHGPGSRRDFRKMHDGVGLKLLQKGPQRGVVQHVSPAQVGFLVKVFSQRRPSLLRRGDRDSATGAEFCHLLAA